MEEGTLNVSTKPRIRVNAKQTSKGEWYLDVTAETDNVEGSVSLLNLGDQEGGGDLHRRRENACEIGGNRREKAEGRLTEPLPTRGSA
jgi:hypothetical protein